MDTIRTEARTNIPTEGKRFGTAEMDLSGRDRVTENVLSNWVGHLVVVATGLVLPRMIDLHVGQTALGIWDLSWSVVSHFGVADIGTGSSVNRYVAKHRAVNDVEGVRRVVCSAMCVQVAAAVLVLILTVAVSWLLPWFFRERLGSEADLASSVIALLGASLAIQVASKPFHGVITGCHRWDLQNGLNAGSELIITVTMIAALSLGGGLRSLALVNLCCVTLTEVARAVLAYRVHPELRVRLTWAEWPQAWDMLVFGAKASLNYLSDLLLFQANRILVASYLGVGALAVYSRPVTLVRQVAIFSNKLAFVLKPTASSLQGTGRYAEIRELLITSTRYGACLTLPMILLLAILGGPILRLWMGPGYEYGMVLAILAIGRCLSLIQQPAAMILTGLNMHGWVGVANLMTALFGIGLSFTTMSLLRWGLVGAALSVAVPLTIGNGIFIIIYACRALAIPLSQYLRGAFALPITCVIPFALCLATIRLLFGDQPVTALVISFAAGTLILGPLYWFFVIPQGLGKRLSRCATSI